MSKVTRVCLHTLERSRIIVGAMAIEGNPYDGHTPQPQLEQVSDMPLY